MTSSADLSSASLNQTAQVSRDGKKLEAIDKWLAAYPVKSRVNVLGNEEGSKSVGSLINICSNLLKRQITRSFNEILDELILSRSTSSVEVIANIAQFHESNLRMIDPRGDLFLQEPARQAVSQRPVKDQLRLYRILVSEHREIKNLSDNEQFVWETLRMAVAATYQPWLRPSNNFVAVPQYPSCIDSAHMQFFREQDSGALWLGKCGQMQLRDEAIMERARLRPDFLSLNADEILEKLAVSIYEMLEVQAPISALSYQQITTEGMNPDMLLAMQLNAADEGETLQLPQSPRMHYLFKYSENFQEVERNFIENYLIQAKKCGNEYAKVKTKDGEFLPLKGLGSILAVADVLYNLCCIGDYCGWIKFLIREDNAGQPYAQLININAEYAFFYSGLRYDCDHDPRTRNIRIAPNQKDLRFADLSPADQREFAMTAKRILELPIEDLEVLFSQVEDIEDGIPKRHWRALLEGFVERRRLFVTAFTHEINQAIISEAEAALVNLVRQLKHLHTMNAAASREEFIEDINLAQILAKLGDGHSSQDEVLNQKKLLKHALSVMVESLGHEHYAVGIVSMYLARAYGRLGNFAKQKDLAQRAMDLLERYYGSRHREAGRALVILGDVYKASKDFEQQIKILERALAILEENFGGEHIEVAKAADSLSEAWGASGNVQKQKELAESALATLEQYYGDEHLEVAKALLNLGYAYRKLDPSPKAAEYGKRAYQIFKRWLKEEDSYVIQAQRLLRECKVKVKKKDLSKSCSVS